MKETRIAEIRANVTADANGLVLEGVPIVYDKPTLINDPAGAFTEIVRAGALDDADLSDVRLIYNHDLSHIPLARTPKTMRLSAGPAGLHMVASLADEADARSVYAAVKRGDVSGMSFCFTVPQGGDRYDPDTNTREILKISKVYEVSVVPFPAYPQASVEARAAIAPHVEQARQNAIILANKILMKEI